MADGFFQEEISVLLDCNVPTAKEDEEHRQPLARMLYLRYFNKYCPASYKGALPVCYLCRQAGHVKTCCPKIASILCYHCRGRGHIARFCPDKGKDRMSNEEKLNSFIEENKSTKRPRVALREDSPRISSMDSVISDS
ncbi:hypothetical protein BDB01DRAFT_174089 [Pilobolus umbonatus]|nr:hypothetical protein BDB01DRAFT_174089 [Pilobolus umbonatus]